MNQNAMSIILLCSHLCLGNDINPYEPSEWTKLANKLMELKLTPADLLNFSATDLHTYFSSDEVERMSKLFSRSGSISFEIEKYAKMGIHIVTRADQSYPKVIKKKLGKNCPPLFYYAGDLTLCNKKMIGFAGSRNIDENDKLFTQKLVHVINKEGYSVVSGGAKGIDKESVAAAISNGSYAIEYVSDSLIKKVKQKEVITALRNKQLLILSIAKPEAGFNTGMAMSRNKFIYAQSLATIIVRSEYNKGGTWAGAIEAMKRELCPVLCRGDVPYSGNIALIKNGAIPINENWNGDIDIAPTKQAQLSLFD